MKSASRILTRVLAVALLLACATELAACAAGEATPVPSSGPRGRYGSAMMGGGG